MILKLLEKAVYSDTAQLDDGNENYLNNNSEDVLTRHLLKLSDIENQFQQLTNRFEEINFKLDKLSNRLSKVQADNQIRFQDLENTVSSEGINKKVTKRKQIVTQGKFCQVVLNLKTWDQYHIKIQLRLKHLSKLNRLILQHHSHRNFSSRRNNSSK